MASTSPQRNRTQTRAATRFLPIGLVLIAIGVVIAILADGGLSSGIGVAFISLGSIPTVVALALMAMAFVERRERRGGPWA